MSVCVYVHLCGLVCVFNVDYPTFGFNCVCVWERRPHGARALCGMPAAAVKPTPEGMVAEGGEGERGVSQWEASALVRERLPLPSLKVPRELLRSFPHSKRVGSYLVGKMINKGSFAKVMEGLHIGTGEKVCEFVSTWNNVPQTMGQHMGRGKDHTHTQDYNYTVTTCALYTCHW